MLSAVPDSSFTLLKGTIGSFPVTLYLFNSGGNYTGSYYYDTQQQPIEFSGSDSGVSGKLRLIAYNELDSTETFTLLANGSTVTGTWQSGTKSLPVSLAPASIGITFQYISLEDSIRLTDTLPHSPVATAEASTVWPRESTATARFVQQQIAELFDSTYTGGSVSSLLQHHAKAFLTDYRMNSDITPADIREFPESLNYAISNHLRLLYLTPQLAMLSFYSYSYTGGAHGNYGTSYLPLDLQNNKRLQLTDLLSPAGIRQLGPLLEKSYRRQQHLAFNQTLDGDGGLFENTIVPNENFYITGSKLVFSYSPYEIGPYAAGEIVIPLELQALQPYLLPAFTALQ